MLKQKVDAKHTTMLLPLDCIPNPRRNPDALVQQRFKQLGRGVFGGEPIGEQIPISHCTSSFDRKLGKVRKKLTDKRATAR